MSNVKIYLEGHLNCGLLIGDEVIVKRKAKNKEGGWKATWTGQMDQLLGRRYFITDDFGEYGFGLSPRKGGEWVFVCPFFVLEKAKGA